MNLNVTKSPVGNGIEKPVLATYEASSIKNSSLKYDGGINGTYDHANLSAKYKNPQNKQQHIPKDAFNQYE